MNYVNCSEIGAPIFLYRESKRAIFMKLFSTLHETNCLKGFRQFPRCLRHILPPALSKDAFQCLSVPDADIEIICSCISKNRCFSNWFRPVGGAVFNCACLFQKTVS